MITLEEAAGRIGADVVYDGGTGTRRQEGVITSVNDHWVFVKYAFSEGSQATPPHRLRFLVPCACFSCGGECGGSTEPGSCGPLAEVDGYGLCDACREKADVFDGDRNAAAVRVQHDYVRLELDPFSQGTHVMRMTPAEARHLAAVLTEKAGSLEVVILP
jgi:hypothetical protein